MNEKSILFLVFLLLIELVISPKTPVRCGDTNFDNYQLSYFECSEGKVDAEVDNLGYKPDTCCYVDYSEGDCDAGYCSTNIQNFCLQVKKDKIEEYMPYLLTFVREFNCITIECDDDWCNRKCACKNATMDCSCSFKTKSSSYNDVTKLFLLFLLVLL